MYLHYKYMLQHSISVKLWCIWSVVLIEEKSVELASF